MKKILAKNERENPLFKILNKLKDSVSLFLLEHLEAVLPIK